MQDRGELHIAVIADDITGGGDTGVQFCPTVGPVYMTGLVDGALSVPRQSRGLALYTNSRHLDPVAAGEAVRLAAVQLLQLTPRRFYKKIDSCLRGNLGAEIDALVVATSAGMSFVAPAFPDQGRTTENDVHKVKGVAVADTEMGRDPLCPVLESRLSHLLSSQSELKVGHVDLACITKGVTTMAQRVRELVANGCRHIAFDATSNSHLDAIIHLVEEHFAGDKVLFVGSAGLAASLARSMTGESEKLPPANHPQIEEWLMVCGSASEVMVAQVVALQEKSGWPRIQLDPARLSAGERLETMNYSSLILSLAPRDSKEIPGISPEKIVEGLSRVVEIMLSKKVPKALFLSGGDTAEAVLARISARGVLLKNEILPGLMLGAIVGGSYQDLPVVTKAGAFGSADILCQLVHLLR